MTADLQRGGPRRSPFPTVDVVVECEPGQVLLVRRRNEPLGWALPGGFVDYGESAEVAARREVAEETGLQVVLTDLLGVYSRPDRDPRHHTITVVYVGRPVGDSSPHAGDDAEAVRAFSLDQLPELAFDHASILDDYERLRATGERPRPAS